MRQSICIQPGERSRASITRTFTIALLLIISGATAALSQPDVMIRDCGNDSGAEPNQLCNGTYYLSPDIWIRRNADWGAQHEQPVGYQPAYIYVRAENKGTSTLEFGTIEVYYGAKSTSLSSWPTKWVSTPPLGDFIGSADIYNLAPNTSIVVEIPWAQVPYNTVTGDHFCLLARFVSEEDPMKVPEGVDVKTNTINNNNIAWKNLTTIYAPPQGNSTTSGGAFSFYNGRGYPVIAHLDFDMDDIGNDQPLPDGLGARIELGAAYAKWAEGGKMGLGPGVIDEPGNNSIVITNTHASIGGISLTPDEEYSIGVQFMYSAEEPPNGNVHNWRISQREDGNPEPIGGIGFEIHMQQGGGLKRTIPQEKALAATLDLSAQPNIGSSSMAIGFTLPADDQITLAVHDLNGRLVRTLAAESSRMAGRHVIIWDGKSDAGTPVPAGTYFYSLSTAGGVAKNQLKIVR